MLNQPLPSSPLVWRNDPAAFSNYPDFFLAHELAHQWWGQAVGWRNYHEQWISEGFAQYFAALYAQHQQGDETFVAMLRQLRKWGIDSSDQGPVSSATVSATSAARAASSARWSTTRARRCCTCCGGSSGDDAFFRGLRRFYRDSRFRKVGTDGFPPRDGTRDRPAARALLPAVDLRFDDSAREGRLPRRGHRRRRARRADRRGLRRAGHGVAAVRGPQAGGRAGPGHRAGRSNAACRSPACCAASRSARTTGCWRRS